MSSTESLRGLIREVVTDSLMGMVSGITGMSPPPDAPPPPFIQASIDRAVDRLSADLAAPEEGVSFGFDDRSVMVGQEAYSIFLEREAAIRGAAVPEGFTLVHTEALGVVLDALVNAPHRIRELQATRTPKELFADNPINVLIADYEAKP